MLLSNLASASFAFIFTVSAFAKTHSVTMKSLSFDPKKIEIKVGDMVEWTNTSFTEHSATSNLKEGEPGYFNTGLVQPQKKSTGVIFSKPGTFLYNCSVHGRTMSASAVVLP